MTNATFTYANSQIRRRVSDKERRKSRPDLRLIDLKFRMHVGDRLPRGLVKPLGFMAGKIEMLDFDHEPVRYKFSSNQRLTGEAKEVGSYGLPAEQINASNFRS